MSAEFGRLRNGGGTASELRSGRTAQFKGEGSAAPAGRVSDGVFGWRFDGLRARQAQPRYDCGPILGDKGCAARPSSNASEPGEWRYHRIADARKP
ncbi:hypothetical protein MPPM_3212 [Methylorubrum populi]|uniref:Uncharacterized protein n=1 Tax=Methylorubrum populi TaxID=223967 RepID=A0A160PF17_9HYPH|nr:hypothetical protein MPPM_3212 [Methylorubrum populi]